MSYLFLLQANLLISKLWLTGWLYLITLVLLFISAFIYHKIKMDAAKNQRADLERQLAERSELLHYAKLDQQKAREETDNANKNKKELLAKISHEIRTPMNAMWGMASLLNETNLTCEQQQYTTTILNSGESLIALINEMLMKDILQHSKTETGKETETKDFDLVNTIEEVQNVFAAKASDTGVELMYHIDDNVPPHLSGDAHRLRQILTNLIENAFRVITSGEILISVRKSKSDSNSLKIEFEVRTTGVGIATTKLAGIMQDLERTETENATEAIGLTLLMCKRLVNQMGGNIYAESREKEGSVFRFTVSLGKSSKNLSTISKSEISVLKGRKVLIIRNSTTGGTLLKQQLEKWSMTTIVLQNAQQTLALLRSDDSFHLVLCDHHQDAINGIDLSHEIKRLHPSLPVVLLNKTGDESFRQHADLFAAVISKPIRRHVLLKELVSISGAKNGYEQKTESKFSADFSQRFPLRILVAEDDAMNQQMVTMVLKKLGYIPVMTSNGKEVLEVVSHSSFDLILMDVQMPEMDGLEATRMIRLCLESQPIIIAMTANTLQGDREECLAAGMDDYLSKPVKLTELMSILEKFAISRQQKQGYHAAV